MTTGKHGRFRPGGGMIHGGISATDNTVETAIASAGVAVPITIFDTNGPSKWITPDHVNNCLLIPRAGNYWVMVSATVNSVSGAGSRLEMTVRKDGGATIAGGLHVDRNIAGGSGASGSVSLSGPVTLAAGDQLEVWIENETNTQNYVVENISLGAIQVGG